MGSVRRAAEGCAVACGRPVVRALRACDNRGAMPLDDRFDDLVASLTGFYRAWVVQLGIELGLFARLREAGSNGLTRADLARAATAAAEPVSAWCDAAYAADLIADDGSRVTVDADVASILLDKDRTAYLGGQFTYTVTASLDYDRMAEYLRTGEPVGSRSPRYYRAIEALTRQDIAVFFEEALAALPDLVADLVRGIDVIDLHCGGGRWLAAIARRFPKARLVGVEPEADSVTRAIQLVQRAGLGSRIRIEAREVDEKLAVGSFDLAYFQHALHEMPDPVVALQSAWRMLRPRGRLIVLGWCLPDGLEEYATLHGQLIAGVALDELFHGARLRTVAQHAELFRAAGLPEPEAIPLPSDATLLVAQRDA
jgi:SAM-dependent methyltransferase